MELLISDAQLKRFEEAGFPADVMKTVTAIMLRMAKGKEAMVLWVLEQPIMIDQMKQLYIEDDVTRDIVAFGDEVEELKRTSHYLPLDLVIEKLEQLKKRSNDLERRNHERIFNVISQLLNSMGGTKTPEA